MYKVYMKQMNFCALALGLIPKIFHYVHINILKSEKKIRNLKHFCF
jgi:hypothetical protein